MGQLIQKHAFFIVFTGVMLVFSEAAFAAAGGEGGGGGAGAGGSTLGGMIYNMISSTYTLPGLITGLAYMAGLIFGFLGIIKLKAHVESPGQVPISDPLKRFVAGGAFFSLPFVADVARRTIENMGAETTNSGFNGSPSGAGLDAMIVRLMADVMTPTLWAVGWIGWIAGLIFVFIGISRLMKTEQEGPRGPTGIGTIATFLTAGALFSLNSIIAYLNNSVFGNDRLLTNGVLQYTQGLGGSASHVHAVISAIIAFSVVLGWISIVRGIFIVRGVGEGNSQASMMAAITHLIGGILAVNLGGVIMAVQKTLGIQQYGIVFN